jgi:hypothetical protein
LNECDTRPSTERRGAGAGGVRRMSTRYRATRDLRTQD